MKESKEKYKESFLIVVSNWNRDLMLMLERPLSHYWTSPLSYCLQMLYQMHTNHLSHWYPLFTKCSCKAFLFHRALTYKTEHEIWSIKHWASILIKSNLEMRMTNWYLCLRMERKAPRYIYFMFDLALHYSRMFWKQSLSLCIQPSSHSPPIHCSAPLLPTFLPN